MTKDTEETALQSFANWLKDVPKDTPVAVTQSKKTIVFTLIEVEQALKGIKKIK